MSVTKTKEERYDRQLRLWGPDGQKRLEQAHVCVLNGCATGSEILKNLVLPGVGKFTIVDHRKVESRDLGNNFFVEIDSVGKSRAQEVARLVHELNPDFVQFATLEEDPEQLINKNPDFVKDYTIIVATDISEQPALKLAESCSKHNVPLVLTRSNGLIGYFRIQKNEHTIIETKPTFPTLDLRLNDPYPELLQYAEKVDYSKLNSLEYSHIPFPIILIKSLKQWREEHGGKDPNGYKENDQFKEEIRKLITTPQQENFPEAIKYAQHAYNPYKLTSNLEEVLNDEKVKNLTNQSSNFWLIAAAVKEFIQNEGKGRAPLLGSIPDMDSTTKTYVDLQKIYHQKSSEDINQVKRHLHTILERLGLPKDKISDDEITLYCKNILFVKVVRFKSLADEHNPSKINMESVSLHLMDFITEQPGNACWYLALRAAEKFKITKGRYPGEDIPNPHDDFEELRKYADELTSAHSLSSDQLPDDHLKELCRFGNSKNHNIASIIGGVGAQEVIKLLTEKWIPCNNTFIFNGIHATSSQLTV